jgi:hypothetical protein
MGCSLEDLRIGICKLKNHMLSLGMINKQLLILEVKVERLEGWNDMLIKRTQKHQVEM